MLTLDLTNAPRWHDVAPGVRVQLRPLTTALMVATRSDPAVEVVPEESSDEERAVAFAKALARRAVLAWEGIGDADGNPIMRSDDDDEDEDGSNMSLAAMETALKPRVLETLDSIASDYERLAEMQDLRMSATLNEDGTFTAKEEAAYQTLRSTIVALVNELHLHNNRIEALVDQIYGINRSIVTIDSGMVKLADAARLSADL